MILAQGGELPDNRVYLDGCSTVTAFKNDKFLKSIKTEARGVKISCNVGAISTNKRGKYGNLKVWYLPDGIANIRCIYIKTNKASHTWTWKGQTKLDRCCLCSMQGEPAMRTKE